MDISIDAKGFYQIDLDIYENNSKIYDAEIDNIFDQLVQFMGVVTD